MTTATLAGGFTYEELSFDSITPNSGPTAGGTNVTLTGVGFDSSLTTVKFGETTAENIVVVSDTEITCDAPVTAAEGSVDVTVIQDATESIIENGFLYYILPTAVYSISPSSGAQAGGETITISGQNFDASTTISIGINPCTSVTLVDAQTITCVTPAGTLGVKDVIADGDNGEYTLYDGFTYYDSQLTITSVSPAVAYPIGTGNITIFGYNFDVTTTITIDGVAVEDLTYTSPTVMIGTIPAGAVGSKNVVATKGGEIYTLYDGFTYIQPLTITSVSPNQLDAAGGDNITITGTSFNETTSIAINGSALIDPVLVSGTNITGTSPANPSGQWSVTATQRSDVGYESYTYDSVTYLNETSLGGRSIKDTYDGLLYIDGGLTAELKPIRDASGKVLPIQVSTTEVKIFDFVLTSEGISNASD